MEAYESGVLISFAWGTDCSTPPRAHPITVAQRYDCGGTEVTVINNYLNVSSKIFCSLPDGPVKEMDRTTGEVLSNYVVNTKVGGDTNIDVSVGDVTFKIFTIDGASLSFAIDKITGLFGEPTITPPIAEQLRNSWQIKLFEPEIKNPKSMADLLKSVAEFAFNIASSGLSLPSGAPQMLTDIVAKVGAVSNDTNKSGVLYEFLLDKLKLTPVKTLLEMMQFGPITMRGQITIKGEENEANAMVEGSFSAPGLVIGTTGPTSPDAVILNNADYKTSKELSLVAWERQDFFTQFSYIDDSPSSVLVAGSLAAGHLIRVLTELVTNVMPVDIVKTLANRAARDLADQFVDHLS